MTESPIFFKLCEIKGTLCTKQMTKAYDPLLRNTRENHDNTREKIFEIYSALYFTVVRSAEGRPPAVFTASVHDCTCGRC